MANTNIFTCKYNKQLIASMARAATFVGFLPTPSWPTQLHTDTHTRMHMNTHTDGSPLATLHPFYNAQSPLMTCHTAAMWFYFIATTTKAQAKSTL